MVTPHEPVRPRQQDATPPALLCAIQRAEAAVRLETEQLRLNAPADLARHRREKDMCLLDLMRQGKAIDGRDLGPQTREALVLLKHAVIENQSILRIHLQAARQISKILMDVLVDAESDRTYGRDHGGRLTAS